VRFVADCIGLNPIELDRHLPKRTPKFCGWQAAQVTNLLSFFSRKIVR
jgi:hypothetical protein